eukprot:UN03942
MPIYPCISYLNDSLSDDYDMSTKVNIKKKEHKPENDNDNKEETNHCYNFIGNKNGRKKKKKVKENNLDLPMVTIYSWGNKCRKSAPVQSQHNTNVCGVTGYKPRGINLKQLNGKDERIQKHVENGKNYLTYLNNLKNKVMNDGLTTISINCHKATHRT